MIHRSSLGTTFALCLCLPAIGTAQQSPDQVRESIEKKLKKEKITLQVEVSGANAVLTGRVRNVFAKDSAVAIALEHPEVEEVEANVEIATAESEAELGKEVANQLRRYGNFTVFDDAGAIVKEGSVVLMGFVTEPYKKTGLEKRLYKVLGIQEFDNQIKVLPNLTQDVRLRRTLANRLYRDPMFSDFASMSIPPIHIIVERSRVLLTGVVSNEMMKLRAEQIIRTTSGVLSVENRLQVGG